MTSATPSTPPPSTPPAGRHGAASPGGAASGTASPGTASPGTASPGTGRGGATTPGTSTSGTSTTGSSAPVEGSTEVLPAVVQKVTAFAAREIPGVVSLGGTASRAVGAVRQTLTGSNDNTAGVRVDMENETARVALDVVIEYGVGARELVRSLRRHVPQAVEEIAGVAITALDIKITDVHLPGEDAAQQ